MRHRLVLLAILAGVTGAVASAQTAQTDPKNFSIDPWHLNVPKPIANPTTSIVEKVPGSDVAAELIYVEMNDGTYSPIAMMKPAGNGRFPLVVLAHMNGGGGTEWLREWLQYGNWTPEQLVKAGYAVAWMRYRAEVDYAYDRIGKLIEDRRQLRQLLNRGPLEYEDVIAIIKHVKTLPSIDPDRIGYLGMSHGGEMAFKIAAEYAGVRAMVANEPASHEFLRLKPDATAQIDPATGLLNVEKMLMREPEKVRARITEDVAMQRIGTIGTPILVQGRDSDELQGIFRVCYDLLKEAGKEAWWASYDHDEHGFIYVRRNDDGVYDPDPVQIKAVRDSIMFFDQHMKTTPSGN